VNEGILTTIAIPAFGCRILSRSHPDALAALRAHCTRTTLESSKDNCHYRFRRDRSRRRPRPPWVFYHVVWNDDQQVHWQLVPRVAEGPFCFSGFIMFSPDARKGSRSFPVSARTSLRESRQLPEHPPIGSQIVLPYEPARISNVLSCEAFSRFTYQGIRYGWAGFALLTGILSVARYGMVVFTSLTLAGLSRIELDCSKNMRALLSAACFASWEYYPGFLKN